jgi:copper(I)-binding protein
MISSRAGKTVFFIALLLTALYAFAHEGKPETKVGSIMIDAAWSRATPKGSNIGAGFLTITNRSHAPDRLLGGTSSIGRVEIHEMKMNSGVMQMRQLKNLVIPAGGAVELKPGGLHIMFMNLKAPLVEGQAFKTTLNFEKAGAMEAIFHVQPGSSETHASR